MTTATKLGASRRQNYTDRRTILGREFLSHPLNIILGSGQISFPDPKLLFVSRRSFIAALYNFP